VEPTAAVNAVTAVNVTAVNGRLDVAKVTEEQPVQIMSVIEEPEEPERLKPMTDDAKVCI